MKEENRVFYLIPQRGNSPDLVDLVLPEDFSLQSDGGTPQMGFGVFVFMRNTRNRGKRRSLSFPVVVGFGENSRELKLTLQADNSDGNKYSSRFSVVEDELTRQLGINASFVARKFSPVFRLSGKIKVLEDNSVWELIPEDRDKLEILWRNNEFYFVGYGELN